MSLRSFDPCVAQSFRITQQLINECSTTNIELIIIQAKQLTVLAWLDLQNATNAGGASANCLLSAQYLAETLGPDVPVRTARTDFDVNILIFLHVASTDYPWTWKIFSQTKFDFCLFGNSADTIAI
jgi:hypothetical protein